jgi:hypothetical protein
MAHAPVVITVLAVGLLAAGAGCSGERSRVVEEPAAAPQDGRDYRSVIERARARQSPAHAQQELEQAVRRFQHDLARLPTSLTELVARRYIPELKAPPDGHVYSYDPVHGNVAVVPVAGDGVFRLPEIETESRRLDLKSSPLPELEF